MVAMIDQFQLDTGISANGRRRSTPTEDPRCRWQVRFWLDLAHDVDYNLAEKVQELKRYRMFTPTIRDGIRLVIDLRAGRLDVLLELFPWIAAKLHAPQPTSIQQQLDDLRAELASLKAAPVPAPPPGPRPLAAPAIAAPVDDDTDTLVIRKAKSDGKSAQNFLNSAFSLIQ